MPDERRYAVRSLRVDDADSAAQVHVQVWRETYADDMSPEYLAGLDPQNSARRWRLRAEVEDPEALCFVAVDAEDSTGGEVVGMAAAGVTRDEDAPTTWELYSISTLERVHGSGVADDLLAAVVGARDASLWVLTTNGRAQAFYTRRGFVVDGARKPHPETGAEEIRMVRRGHALPA
jgi:ribosomal protein S18 acetylase RimI-like enzyme